MSQAQMLNWEGMPPPDVICASNPARDGVDFREFHVNGYNLIDYNCPFLQVIIARQCSLRVRKPGESGFGDAPIGTISSSLSVPGDRVQCEWSGSGRFLGIYLPPDFIERSFERPFHAMTFATSKEKSPVVEHLLMAMRADVRQGSLAGPSFIQSAAISILHCLHVPVSERPLVAKGGLSARQLSVLKDVICADLGNRLSLEQLSREVGLSTGHLCRAFKVSTGLSPHQYILRVRVARAKHLIRTTSNSLDEVAEDAGFADASHLSTVFLKMTGQTPSQFRNS